MRRSPHNSDHAYVIQNLVHVRDIREVGQRGDLFDRQRARRMIILESCNNNDSSGRLGPTAKRRSVHARWHNGQVSGESNEGASSSPDTEKEDEGY